MLIAHTELLLQIIDGTGPGSNSRPHTFVKIDHEIISTVNLLPSAESFKKGCFRL